VLLLTARAPLALSGPRWALALLLLLLGCSEPTEKLVAAGRQYMDRQEYNAATIQFKNALKTKPDDPEARYLLGLSLLKLHDLASAEKELRKAAEFGYPADKVLPTLALALMKQGKAEDLISELKNIALSDTAAQAELQTQLGNAYLASSKVDQAEESFSKAIQLQSGYAPARVGQARVLAVRGDVEHAEQIVDELLRTDAKLIEALKLKAGLLRARGKLDEAIGYLKQVVDAQPDDVASALALGLVLVSRQRFDEASQQIQSLKKVAPRDPRTTYLQCLMAFSQGDFVAARDLVLQVLRAAPEHLPSLVIAGAASYQLGAQRQAQDFLRKALDRAPQSPYVQRLLVASYVRSGDTARAAHLLDLSLQHAPNDPGLLMLAGEMALARRDLAGAAKFYQQAESNAPNPAIAGIRLGQIEFAEGNPQHAIQMLEKVSASDDQRYQSELLLSLYYARSGQTQKALQWIDAIEKKRPQLPIASTLRGAVYLQSNDRQAARQHFEHALSLQGDFVPALEGLARVDVAEGKPEAARRRFEEVLDKQPGNEVLALSCTRALRDLGAPVTELVEILRRTVQTNPTALQARASLISAYLELKDSRQALTAAEEALAVSPDNSMLLTLAGRAQLMGGAPNQAVATFEKLVSLQPHAVAPLLMLADAHIAGGEREKASAKLNQALEYQEDLVEAQSRLIQLYVADGRATDAIAMAKKIQRQRPKEGVGYKLEADVHLRAADWKEAFNALEKGYAMTSSGALVPPLHTALVKLGRQPAADALTQKWLKENPRDLQVRAYLAESAMKSKNYESAAGLYREMLSIQPNAPLALNNLAWVAGEMKDPRALKYAEEANKLLPNTPPIMDTLGWLLVEEGAPLRGVQLLQKAVELAPQLYDIRLHLAKSLMQVNQKDLARKELEYLQSHVQDTQVRAELEALLRQL